MTNKVALITGGSRGIGKGIALAFAKQGIDIAICYKSQESQAAELVQQLNSLDVKVIANQCDITNIESVKSWIRSVEQELGEIDIVVNSAGITKDKPLALMSFEDWHDVVNTNLNGMYNVCHSSILSMMKRKSGCIINLSSISGVYGNPMQTNYSATKAGIIGFTKSLAKEVAGYNIRVNALAPGFIETDMTAEIGEKKLTELLDSVPMKRIGTVSEVAGAAAFLISDAATYITGQVLGIDGGLVV